MIIEVIFQNTAPQSHQVSQWCYSSHAAGMSWLIRSVEVQ